MKLLLILESDEVYNVIALYVKALGFEFIRYHSVIKAMDNIDEVSPHAIIVSAKDFPRHWKIIVQFVRSQRSKESCPIIVLKGNNFALEETSKAYYLGVNGVVPEALDNRQEISQLQNILGRYIPVDEKRRAQRYQPDEWSRFGFVLISPGERSIITGAVKTISATGISFCPDYSAWTKDIRLNMELSECSLRVGDQILSPVCRLVRTGRIISFEFTSFPQDEQSHLNSYLEDLPLKELKAKRQKAAAAAGNKG
ncbi:MAG: PilZ domain-containing protein [Treponema sp.]|jgi:DNA-binding response OmpR family regulator|nr:PilZ domain-containing protein [Treponema sp.]